ncbi:LLM class flavin-dependent oxidoreductase [Streptomyces sp. 1331.2]|uniref:LLM class flavin-dependent oxidoreductase n=1 Tax=Streptomyces sp. 1331.2 TaxID=1938835 RepID=UPI000BC595E8|nr:LLM class flavin-dependent oxidoreductase [Streptomyces sp. 1331.2]SOB81161.1 Flavin-dependent oxidoreductase, luciferase family (includes alkanesulfonate monooxygenase SsuD and methylene tetrahydromethanopterin reductase) [Streptomyces sp. 1331.2]
MDIGVYLPTGQAQWAAAGPRSLIEFARRAEQSGFCSLFVNDSLLTPRIEPLTMLAAVAPVTERIRLGTGALLPVLRRPVQTAQTLASVDQLSGGRLTVAVGAGFPGRFGRPLHELSQVPWERRFARLDETVALWRALWAGATEFRGAFHSFTELPPATRPFRTEGPPVWLGGATPAALARTGRHYDGWMPYPPDPADYTTGLAAVRAAARQASRAPESVTPALFVNVRIDRSARSARRVMDAYTRANYGLPLAETERIQAFALGTPQEVAATLARYTAAGAHHLVARLGALEPPDQLEQLDRLAAVTNLGST